MSIFSSIPQQLTDAVKNCKRAVVCGHLNPDGDCANSVMAMGLLLKSLGKQYILVNEGSFLRPEIEEFKKSLSEAVPQEYQNKDTLGIVVDCSTYDRLGIYANLFENVFTTVVIDHHSSGFSSDASHYIVPSSPSTTLLIYKLFKALNVELNKEISQLIFRGFATDSGFFKFLGENSAECFEIVADLVRCGVNPSIEYANISGGKPFNTVKFLAAIIERTEMYFDGRLAVSHEQLSDCGKFGDNSRASDEYYAQMFTVKGVEAIAFFKVSNKVENAIEVGMRASATSSVNVGAIAAKHGGGGHVKAAGVTIKGSYEEVKNLILKEFASVLNTQYENN